MPTLTDIPVITREYYRLPVSLTVAGAVIDPTALDIDFALVTVGDDPVDADWKPGTWETIPATVDSDPVYLARAFMGDATTDFPLAAGVIKDLWWRITDNPERPTRFVAQVRGT